MRMTPLSLVAFTIQVFTIQMVASTPAFCGGYDDRSLVIFYCSRCHAADQYYLAERSEKAWQLVVKRMQGQQYEEEASFNDEEAKRIIEYLVAHPYSNAHYMPLPRPFAEPIAEAEPTVAAAAPATPSDEFADSQPTPGSSPDETVDPSPASDSLADEPPAPAPTIDESADQPPAGPVSDESAPDEFVDEPPLPASTSNELADRPPTPAELAIKAKLATARLSPAKATGLAKVMGYIAVAALALMVITGLMRNKIGQVFRKTHGVLAFIFCGSLTVHAAVFLAEYGAPGVLWLWFGIIATVILLSSEFTGLLHLQNRKLFIKYHVVAGVTGLTLTAAHWIWIYI